MALLWLAPHASGTLYKWLLWTAAQLASGTLVLKAAPVAYIPDPKLKVAFINYTADTAGVITEGALLCDCDDDGDDDCDGASLLEVGYDLCYSLTGQWRGTLS